VVRTWGPRGNTPVLRHRYRKMHLSVAGAITVSPILRRCGFYYRVHQGAFKDPDIVAAVRDLLGHHPNGLLIVWDNLNAHRGPEMRKFLSRTRRVHLERLPAYSPDLNPQEPVWRHLKQVELANYAPPDLPVLARSIHRAVRRVRRRPHLLRSFFDHCDPPLKL
jgi:transposase